jgi:hypothetical protein
VITAGWFHKKCFVTLGIGEGTFFLTGLGMRSCRKIIISLGFSRSELSWVSMFLLYVRGAARGHAML